MKIKLSTACTPSASYGSLHFPFGNYRLLLHFPYRDSSVFCCRSCIASLSSGSCYDFICFVVDVFCYRRVQSASHPLPSHLSFRGRISDEVQSRSPNRRARCNRQRRFCLERQLRVRLLFSCYTRRSRSHTSLLCTYLSPLSNFWLNHTNWKCRLVVTQEWKSLNFLRRELCYFWYDRGIVRVLILSVYRNILTMVLNLCKELQLIMVSLLINYKVNSGLISNIGRVWRIWGLLLK